MSSQRLTPLEAVNSRQVIAWNGITTPEHRIDWNRLRMIVSRCKNAVTDSRLESWTNQAIEVPRKTRLAEFHDITLEKVVRFFRSIDTSHKQALLSLAKFPFGIHRCYIDAGVLYNGYVSEHFMPTRFFNPTGWMHLIDRATDSTEIGQGTVGFTEPIQTLLGKTLSYPASVILDGCRGMSFEHSSEVFVLILTSLVHDCILDQPFYRAKLGFVFR